jgi:NTP pyrophosphatase (non-canonical NTP hydrolase)
MTTTTRTRPDVPFAYETTVALHSGGTVEHQQRALVVQPDKDGATVVVTYMGESGAGTQMHMTVPTDRADALADGVRKAAGIAADMTLADVQAYMRDMTARHGFTTDPHNQVTLMLEEFGELARVVKQIARGQLDPSDYACKEEFADVLITLAGLANILDVDLADAFAAKTAINDNRTWDLGLETTTKEN